MTCLCSNTVIGPHHECEFDLTEEAPHCTCVATLPILEVQLGELDFEARDSMHVVRVPWGLDDVFARKNLEDNATDLVEHISSLAQPKVWRQGIQNLPGWLFQKAVEVFAIFRDAIGLPPGCTLKSLLKQVEQSFQPA